MPNWRVQARRAAKEVGIDPGLFTSLVQHESGFNPNAGSPAGAHGLSQLMPGTARALGQRYGINTSTPYGNLLGGAHYLKEQLDRFGSPDLALAAYNAGPGAVSKYGGVPPYKETQAYVRNVMASSGGRPGATTGVSAPPSFGGLAPPATAAPGLDVAGLINQNLGQIAMGQISPLDSLSGLVEAINAQPPAQAEPVDLGGALTGQPSSAPMTQGQVTVAANADRPGVDLQPGVLNFANLVSAQYGKPLTITTGTRHNQYVVNTNRQSAHWTGNAADIAASGDQLTKMGRAALVAAGMSPAVAARVHGGLFNVGGYQIIFNTNEGGNHYNHLHIGIH